MRRGLLATLIVAAIGGLLAVSGTAGPRDGGVPAPAAFVLADGSAGCAYADGELACRTDRMDGSVVLAADGTTSVADVRVGWDHRTTVLRPTESWWHGGFSCSLAEGRLVCSTLDGGALAVSAR